MNTPSPLVPQGTMPDKGKSHIRIAVFTILAIHVVLLSALLIAGCKKTSETAQQDVPPPVVTPPVEPPPPLVVDSNPPPVVPSNPPVVVPLIEPPPVVEPPPPALSEHTIVKGDTFAILAKKYGVTTKAVEAANPGVNPTRLKIGQKIKIPPPKTTAANGAAAVNGVVAGTGEKVYTVKSGDNLMKIGKTFGVSAKQLRAYNNLRTDQIKVGQKLKIPVKAAAPPPVDATVPPAVPAPNPGTVPPQ
jgi:LysM repeat protein